MNQEEREAKDVWYVVRNASWYMKSESGHQCEPRGEGGKGRPVRGEERLQVHEVCKRSSV